MAPENRGDLGADEPQTRARVQHAHATARSASSKHHHASSTNIAASSRSRVPGRFERPIGSHGPANSACSQRRKASETRRRRIRCFAKPAHFSRSNPSNAGRRPCHCRYCSGSQIPPPEKKLQKTLAKRFMQQNMEDIVGRSERTLHKDLVAMETRVLDLLKRINSVPKFLSQSSLQSPRLPKLLATQHSQPKKTSTQKSRDLARFRQDIFNRLLQE